MDHTVISEQLAVNKRSTVKEEAKGRFQNTQLIGKFIRIIPFVDRPIRKKFLIFNKGMWSENEF